MTLGTSLPARVHGTGQRGDLKRKKSEASPRSCRLRFRRVDGKKLATSSGVGASGASHVCYVGAMTEARHSPDVSMRGTLTSPLTFTLSPPSFISSPPPVPTSVKIQDQQQLLEVSVIPLFPVYSMHTQPPSTHVTPRVGRKRVTTPGVRSSRTTLWVVARRSTPAECLTIPPARPRPNERCKWQDDCQVSTFQVFFS